MQIFKFRPSSHSEDYTIIATYRDAETAKRVEEALHRMLEDMEENMEDYDTDWGPDEADVSVEGDKVYFEVYTAGYLDCVESLIRKVAKPVSVECYQNFQQLEISVVVPKGLTPETAMLVMDSDEAEVVKWLTKNCGPPQIADCGDGKHQVFKWFYRGDEIYYDGVLNVGFEFPIDDMKNWEVDYV